MRHRYHPPGPVLIRGDLTPATRRALEEVVRAAVGRAVDGLSAASGLPSDASSAAARPAAQELATSVRAAGRADGLRVPSYDDHGRPVDLPLRPRDDVADVGVGDGGASSGGPTSAGSADAGSASAGGGVRLG